VRRKKRFIFHSIIDGGRISNAKFGPTNGFDLASSVHQEVELGGIPGDFAVGLSGL
jgi:hypothetical protein